LLEQMALELEVEGEMHGEAAISEKLHMQIFPNSRLKGETNLLIMLNLDAAKSIHILTPNATVRRIVNMSALAVTGVETHCKEVICRTN